MICLNLSRRGLLTNPYRVEVARELYADEWPGFTESELESMLAAAGFTATQTSVVDKNPDAPQFQTLLAVAEKSQ